MLCLVTGRIGWPTRPGKTAVQNSRALTLLGWRERAAPGYLAAAAWRLSTNHEKFKQSAGWLQEHAQIIARVSGKPATKAPTIVNVNAKSKLISGRVLPANMLVPSRPALKKAATGTIR
jgi:hypothetical protein